MSLQLPSEVWTQVFGFLCTAERLKLRTVSKSFRDLVDGSGLLEDLTVTLRMNNDYNDYFWDTLRRWSVTSVVMSGFSDYSQVLFQLPQLTSLTLEDHHPNGQESPQRFSNLEFTSLTSLEIIDFSFSCVSKHLMKMLPSLRSLALFFTSDSGDSVKLGSWLRDLSALTSLTLVRGPPVGNYSGSIPSSLTSLTLRPAQISSAEIRALSQQLPELRLLHLEPHRSALGADVDLLPLLFPGLHSLHISLQEVPEELFLSLADLKELQLLEILDLSPPPEHLLQKLRELTQNRVQISVRAEQEPLEGL